MEAIHKNSKNPLFRKLGLSGIGLCALLCSLPVIGAVLGMGALTAAAHFEKIGASVLIVLIGSLGFWFYKRRRHVSAASSCDIDCCKTEAKTVAKTDQ